jgi:uncharacterized membrane protein
VARRVAALAASALAALALAGVAHGQTYELVSSDVQANVRGDGAVAVDEAITVAFSGSFTYGFREIPLRAGERIDEIGVTENGRPFQPGASTELEPGGPPGTFGVRDLDGRVRIVWRFTTDGFAQRTFVIHYRIAGLAVAYDDVVDVNLKVWGDEWEQRLGRLTATMRGPGDVVRAWGHPVWVRGDVTIDGRSAILRALDVDAGQFVELRTLYPRDTFTSTGGMRVASGSGLAKITAEELDDAQAYERDKEKIDEAKAHPWRSALIVLAIGTIPALLIAMAVFWWFGREPETGYDREYEQEPPTDTEAALVPTLLRQGGEAGSFEFTATLFDLIRRGHYAAVPATTERSIWAGIRTERISDLELSAGKPVDLTPWERSVTTVVDDVLDGGTVRLSEFREKIEDERTEMAPRFDAFKGAVSNEIGGRRWFRSLGIVPLVGGMLAFGAIGAILAWIAIDGWRTVYPRWSDVVLIGLAFASFVNAAVLLGASTRRKLWRRRSREAAIEAERWDAFRRYLQDFPRLQEAPPATLELWERLLVYGIAFGIAERVLQAAHLAMPEALAQASSIYWISGQGNLGSGASAMSIGDLASGFGSALAPPSSGSGGFGGGFSGGGGGRWRRRRRRLRLARVQRDERERDDRRPGHHLELACEERGLDLGAAEEVQLLLLEVVGVRLGDLPGAAGQEEVPDPAASVAVDGVAAERRPVRSLVPRLLEELAPGGGERLLAVLEVAADRRERRPLDGVLRLPEEEERAVVGDGDDVDELTADDPRPVLDHLAVGELDDVALDGQPRAPLEDGPPRSRPPGAHHFPPRDAWYSAIAPAAATFRDSAAPGSVIVASMLSATISVGSPARSAPRRKVIGGPRSTASSGAPPCARSAIRRPGSASQATSETRKIAPAEARSAFGDVGSAQPRESATLAPKASAVRIRVPTLPGSTSCQSPRQVCRSSVERSARR